MMSQNAKIFLSAVLLVLACSFGKAIFAVSGVGEVGGSVQNFNGVLHIKSSGTAFINSAGGLDVDLKSGIWQTATPLKEMLWTIGSGGNGEILPEQIRGIATAIIEAAFKSGFDPATGNFDQDKYNPDNFKAALMNFVVRQQLLSQDQADEIYKKYANDDPKAMFDQSYDLLKKLNQAQVNSDSLRASGYYLNEDGKAIIGKTTKQPASTVTNTVPAPNAGQKGVTIGYGAVPETKTIKSGGVSYVPPMAAAPNGSAGASSAEQRQIAVIGQGKITYQSIGQGTAAAPATAKTNANIESPNTGNRALDIVLTPFLPVANFFWGSQSQQKYAAATQPAANKTPVIQNSPQSAQNAPTIGSAQQYSKPATVVIGGKTGLKTIPGAGQNPYGAVVPTPATENTAYDLSQDIKYQSSGGSDQGDRELMGALHEQSAGGSNISNFNQVGYTNADQKFEDLKTSAVAMDGDTAMIGGGKRDGTAASGGATVTATDKIETKNIAAGSPSYLPSGYSGSGPADVGQGNPQTYVVSGGGESYVPAIPDSSFKAGEAATNDAGAVTQVTPQAYEAKSGGASYTPTIPKSSFRVGQAAIDNQQAADTVSNPAQKRSVGIIQSIVGGFRNFGSWVQSFF